MINEIVLAIIQAATEFLPISSSGHLALISNLIGISDIFFFTILHIASLIAVLFFTREEIYQLITFERKYRKMWIFLIIATIPAALFGLFFKSLIESSFSSFLFLGIAFIFTGFVLLLTRFARGRRELNWKNTLFVGLFQVLALFPGVSRSGMTISAGLFSGIEREKAAKFSFLLFIPLSIGAVILESGKAYFSISLLLGFFITFILSLVFLQLLLNIIKKGKFWMFSFYCFLVGIISLILYLFL
ncbi:MAG: undecaprenyl-diphosphate phosphatase [Nanoarchaeota archaeon]